MIRVCCQCGEILGEVEPLDDKRTTHGYCAKCRANLDREAAEFWASDEGKRLAAEYAAQGA